MTLTIIINIFIVVLLWFNLIVNTISLKNKNQVILELILNNTDELKIIKSQVDALTDSEKIRYVRKQYAINIDGSKKIVDAINN